MTRKHFKAFAEMLANMRNRAADMCNWREWRDNIANVLRRYNGRFDRGRFDRATEE